MKTHPPKKKISVGILGATGMVGQRFLSLLDHHPWFEPVWLAASERSAGKCYVEAAKWCLRTPLPRRFADLKLAEAVPRGRTPRIVFAALDAGAAATLEPEFVKAGHCVISNSSALRMHEYVPLLVPEVNPDHIGLIDHQPDRNKSGGYAVTNPNCSTIGLVMALAPLAQAFGVEQVLAVTMQAVSGAGYPGVPSLDILGNVIPFIANEEEKMEREAQKILGRMEGSSVIPASFSISAHCNRVPVEDGHTEAVSVKLKTRVKSEDVARVLREYRGLPQELQLPSAPSQPVIVAEAPDRPQPRFDSEAGNGMSVVIGRVRPCPLLDVKFTVLSHNTIRGAAGAAILNAELLYAEGRL